MIKVFSAREKLIFCATLAVIIFTVVFNLFIAPILAKNDNLNREIKVVNAKLKKYTLLLNKREYIQNKYNEFSERFGSGITERGVSAGILTELEDLAKASGIRIIDRRPQAPKLTASYKETAVELKTEGAMSGYLKFVYSLEHSFSLFRIRKFQLNARSNAASLEGSFSISKLSLP